MLITHSASIVSQIYFDFSDKGSIILDRMTIITYPLIGALNFTAFCCDPTVHDAVKAVLYKIKVIKNNEKKDGSTLICIFI
ncbi:hypothetical protein K502DRAFT_326085 [Neoconidiobolus thromboides FSU 785]|nr:hypothetical protein K502DRAFT_326085 [Neoconidiobolus thromboides FSU 785]